MGQDRVRWWLVGRSTELNMHCGDVWALHLFSWKTGAAAVQYLAADRRELPAFAHVKVPGLQQLLLWRGLAAGCTQALLCSGGSAGGLGGPDRGPANWMLFRQPCSGHTVRITWKWKQRGPLITMPEDGSHERVDFNLNGNTRGGFNNMKGWEKKHNNRFNQIFDLCLLVGKGQSKTALGFHPPEEEKPQHFIF